MSVTGGMYCGAGAPLEMTEQAASCKARLARLSCMSSRTYYASAHSVLPPLEHDGLVAMYKGRQSRFRGSSRPPRGSPLLRRRARVRAEPLVELDRCLVGLGVED